MDSGEINWSEVSWGELPVAEEKSPMEVETAADIASRGLGAVLDHIKDDTIGVTISPASLCPPTQLTGGDGHWISWLLLDLTAYIADQQNATTATSFTRARHEIQATLCPAPPPRVSHLSVHCPGLKPEDFGTEPRVLSTCRDLVLFKAAICKGLHAFEQAMQDYFVYRPARLPADNDDGRSSGPSLTLLPHPGRSRRFAAWQVGIVQPADAGFLQRHGQNRYVVAALCHSDNNVPGEGAPSLYYLHRFDSTIGDWTTDELQLGPMDPSPGLSFFYHRIDKVILLEGGFMAWVDLSQGILLCNVFAKEPKLYYIALPIQLSRQEEQLAAVEADRDVAFVQGKLKFVEHQTQVRPVSFQKGTYISDNWTATVHRWEPSGLEFWEGNWVKQYACDASRLSGSLSDLIPDDVSMPLPPLPSLHTGHPTFSLDEEDVVYILAKVDHRDEKAFVLAVNLSNGVLQEAHSFGAERMVGISFCYAQTKVSAKLYISSGKEKRLVKRSRLQGFSSGKTGVQFTTYLSSDE